MNGQNKVLDAFRASVTYGSTTYNFNNNYGLAEAAAGYPPVSYTHLTAGDRTACGHHTRNGRKHLRRRLPARWYGGEL